MNSPRPSTGHPPVRGGRLLRLGTVLGVPVFVTPSWVLVALFVTISYADFLRTEVTGLSTAGAYLLALAYSILLALSVLVHELGHTLVSRFLGLTVHRIVVFLLGGVSEIEGEARRPRDEFLIAAAGPFASFVLAAGCVFGALATPRHSTVGVTFALLAWSNLVVAVFNVLPGLPLDGGRLVQALVWMVGGSRRRGAIVAAWSGRVVAILLAIAVVAANALLSKGDSLSLTGIAAAAMGFALASFMWLGATQALRVATVEGRAESLRVPALTRPAVYVPAEQPLSEALRRLGEAQARAIVTIDREGRSRALVRESAVRDTPPARRPWVQVGELARPLEAGLVLPEALSGDELMAALRTTPASEYLIVGADGVSRGVLATSDVLDALGLSGGGRNR